MHAISFTLVNGIILIPAIANEQAGYFAFDTGAMQTAVNKVYFSELQGKRIDIGIFSEKVKESVADKGILTSLRFSDIKYVNLPVLIMDLMYVENVLKTVMPEMKLLGTLGIDVISNYTVLLDYNSLELVLNPRQGFDNHIIVPMKIETLPVIKIEVADRTFDFVLDTGANTCLLGQSFLNDHHLIPVSEVPKIVTMPDVCVGKNRYKDITATISDISAIQKKVPVEGVIGYQILSQQRTILDFRNHQLVLETSCPEKALYSSRINALISEK